MEASELLVTLLRSLSRLISPNGRTVDRRSYPKLVAVPMESDKLSKLSNKTRPVSPKLRRLAEDVERHFLGLPPSMPFDLQSDPLSQFFLEPWDQEDSPS